MPSRLGLIAGNGLFPGLVARGARAQGVEVIAVAHEGETERSIETEVTSCTWVRVGQLGRIIETFRRAGCDHAVMAGGIGKARLFGGFRPDLRGAALLARLRTLHDDKILRGIAEELEGEGIPVVESTRYMPELVPLPGLVVGRKLKGRERDDIAFGRRVAAAVGAFEIGQTVVVRDGLVFAVEAVEGTDAAIRRGGALARRGAVVVKASKPGQDLRFDVPAVGPATIAAMQESGATVLAVEARRSIFFERKLLERRAREAGISVVAFDPEELP